MHEPGTSEQLLQQEYYNKIADEYNRYFFSDLALSYRYYVYSRFLKNLSFGGKTVLDAMCGGGQNTGFFIRQKAIVTGIDISENQCNEYKKRFPECKVYCTSILNNNIPENSFDYIITDSLHHIHPNVKICMAEFYRLLKPGGFLILWEPSSKSVFDYVRKLWYKYDKKYFQKNESSIDLKRLQREHQRQFRLIKKQYGGNFAYLLLMQTMALRINPKRSRFFKTILLFIESIFNAFQNRYNALWFIALFQKI